MRTGFAILLTAIISAHGDDSVSSRVVAQARAALGGDARLSQVQGLSATGTFMRQMPDQPQVGDLKIDVQLPDKLLRTDSVSGMGPGVFMRLSGINGGTLLRKSKILNAGPGARMSQPDLAGGTEATALRSERANLARLVLAMLVATLPGLAIEFSYGGEAESPDGRADVLDAKGADGFAARLFLDKSTHRPLMLTFRAYDPRMFKGASASSPRGQSQAALASPAADEIVEHTLFFDGYRAVDGVLLPHHIARAVDGARDEEWMFKTIKVNPVFKADAFTDR